MGAEKAATALVAQQDKRIAAAAIPGRLLVRLFVNFESFIFGMGRAANRIVASLTQEWDVSSYAWISRNDRASLQCAVGR